MGFGSYCEIRWKYFSQKNKDKNSYTFVVSSSKDKFKAKQKGAATGPVRCIIREIPLSKNGTLWPSPEYPYKDVKLAPGPGEYWQFKGLSSAVDKTSLFLPLFFPIFRKRRLPVLTGGRHLSKREQRYDSG